LLFGDDRAVERTWDGLPVVQEKPWVSAVVVWRDGSAGREFLLLHRHHQGPEFEGDWAWTSPAGARQPGETPDDAARRELHEETGLTLSLRGPLEHVTEDVALYVAESESEAEVVIDVEHDRFEWVTLEVAVRRCLPAVVAEGIRIADRAASSRSALGAGDG
jgi:8-oxo-dGTP pyrophosphatase MutT (NUDIX family)